MTPVVIFDVFRTLVDFDGDHVDDATWAFLADWLAYRGATVEPEDLHHRYAATTDTHLRDSPGDPPDVDVLAVWADVLQDLPGAADLVGWEAEVALLYRQLTTRRLAVHAGTHEMLDALDGLRLAIVSNTQRAYTEAELARLGLLDRFEVVVFSSDVRACKPDPAPFRRALALLDVEPDDCVYIGDNPVDDVLGATRVGIATVLLDRGTPVPDDAVTLQPTHVVPGDRTVEAARRARALVEAP